MPKPYWNRGYSGETLGELLALSNDYAVDSLAFPLEMAIEQKLNRVGEDALSEEEHIILAIEALEREVNNGGYSQFFINSSRVYTPLITHALRRIGCPKTAGITERAIKAAGFSGLDPAAMQKALDDYQEDWVRQNSHRIVNDAGRHNEMVDRESTAEGRALEEALNQCDQDYYSSGEFIAEKLFQFVEANATTIQF